MICIYCLQDKDKSSFKKKEHVLPQSFGKFKDNFTLKNTVCDECNQFFGDNLELLLAGDTFEGSTLRYEVGIKKVEKFNSLGKRSRMIIQLQEGNYPGIYVYREYSDEVENITLNPCPQIGFLKSTGEYEWHLLGKLPERESLKHEHYNFSDPKFGIILGCEQEQAEKIFNELGLTESKSVNITTASDEFRNEALCEAKGELDDTDFRARAKMGFNYLAYWKGRNFVLSDDFNIIRDYIRWGKIPEIPVRGVINKPFFLTKEKREKSE